MTMISPHGTPSFSVKDMSHKVDEFVESVLLGEFM